MTTSENNDVHSDIELILRNNEDMHYFGFIFWGACDEVDENSSDENYVVLEHLQERFRLNSYIEDSNDNSREEERLILLLTKLGLRFGDFSFAQQLELLTFLYFPPFRIKTGLFNQLESKLLPVVNEYMLSMLLENIVNGRSKDVNEISKAIAGFNREKVVYLYFPREIVFEDIKAVNILKEYLNTEFSQFLDVITELKVNEHARFSAPASIHERNSDKSLSVDKNEEEIRDLTVSEIPLVVAALEAIERDGENL